jgi:hypothetical protein
MNHRSVLISYRLWTVWNTIAIVNTGLHTEATNPAFRHTTKNATEIHSCGVRVVIEPRRFPIQSQLISIIQNNVLHQS